MKAWAIKFVSEQDINTLREALCLVCGLAEESADTLIVTEACQVVRQLTDELGTGTQNPCELRK